MPCLKIFTNIAKDKIPADFISKLIPILSRTVKKPEHRFIVVVTTDCMVGFGHEGTGVPSAVSSLESIGHLGLEENKIITKEVTDFVCKELGIAPNNFLITYYDLEGMNAGKNGVLLA